MSVNEHITISNGIASSIAIVGKIGKTCGHIANVDVSFDVFISVKRVREDKTSRG